MTINTLNKQQQLADEIAAYKTAFIVGLLNNYEFAGKLLTALEQMEVRELNEQCHREQAFAPDHDCKLDDYGTGHCDHPSHQFDLVNDEGNMALSDHDNFLLAN
jgi:hypothetical protein